jgi:hypothetical protein
MNIFENGVIAETSDDTREKGLGLEILTQYRLSSSL